MTTRQLTRVAQVERTPRAGMNPEHSGQTINGTINPRKLDEVVPLQRLSKPSTGVNIRGSPSIAVFNVSFDLLVLIGQITAGQSYQARCKESFSGQEFCLA